MKVCRTCGKTFGDEMMFCLEDGTGLVADEQPTVVRSAPKDSSSSKFVMLILGGMLVVGFVLITAAIGGGIWYYSSLPERTAAQAEPTITPTPTWDNTFAEISPTPTEKPIEDKPTSTPSKTPKTEPSKTPTPKPDAETDEPTSPPQKQITGGVLNRKATYLPQPPYPPAARAVRVSGRVFVQVLVGKSGDVIMASAYSGPALLRPAAVRAARQAKFPPTYFSGQPVTNSGVLVYTFKL